MARLAVRADSSVSPTAHSIKVDAEADESQTVLPSVTSGAGEHSTAAASGSNDAQQDDTAAPSTEVNQTRAAIASEVERSVQEHLLYGTSETPGRMSDASLQVRCEP